MFEVRFGRKNPHILTKLTYDKLPRPDFKLMKLIEVVGRWESLLFYDRTRKIMTYFQVLLSHESGTDILL